jgi:hypothetical protein
VKPIDVGVVRSPQARFFEAQRARSTSTGSTRPARQAGPRPPVTTGDQAPHASRTSPGRTRSASPAR